MFFLSEIKDILDFIFATFVHEQCRGNFQNAQGEKLSVFNLTVFTQ